MVLIDPEVLTVPTIEVIDYSWEWFNVTIDTLIYERPALVRGAILGRTSSSNNFQLRNGKTVSDTILLHFKAPTNNETHYFTLPVPMYFSVALFVDAISTPDACWVLWKPANRPAMYRNPYEGS